MIGKASKGLSTTTRLIPPSARASTSSPIQRPWEQAALFRSLSLASFRPILLAVRALFLVLSTRRSQQPLVNPTLKALGIPERLSPLGGNNNGASWTPASIDPNTRARSYSASQYLWPNLKRKNLAVVANATVTRIDLSTVKGLQVATGVKYALNSNKSEIITVTAKKEVILSAGSIQTPQLLELSGIGQTAILSKFGIKTKINLPGVGENLQGELGITRLFATHC